MTGTGRWPAYSMRTCFPPINAPKWRPTDAVDVGSECRLPPTASVLSPTLRLAPSHPQLFCLAARAGSACRVGADAHLPPVQPIERFMQATGNE
jgi:hypothetical protein